MNSNSTENKDIRKFGIIAFVFFGFLCALGIWAGKTIPIYLFGALCILGMGFLIIPGLMRPVYQGWLKFAHSIGRVITSIVLTFGYYLVITPFGLIKRLFGGVPLQRTQNRDVPTYWVVREVPLQPKERFLKRY